MESYAIHFTILIDEAEFKIQTYPHQYQSLMTLISDRFNLADFGLCCGMGSCGTCDVKINGLSVLACETAIDRSLSKSVIMIDKQLIQVY